MINLTSYGIYFFVSHSLYIPILQIHVFSRNFLVWSESMFMISGLFLCYFPPVFLCYSVLVSGLHLRRYCSLLCCYERTGDEDLISSAATLSARICFPVQRLFTNLRSFPTSIVIFCLNFTVQWGVYSLTRNVMKCSNVLLWLCSYSSCYVAS